MFIIGCFLWVFFVNIKGVHSSVPATSSSTFNHMNKEKKAFLSLFTERFINYLSQAVTLRESSGYRRLPGERDLYIVTLEKEKKSTSITQFFQDIFKGSLNKLSEVTVPSFFSKEEKFVSNKKATSKGVAFSKIIKTSQKKEENLSNQQDSAPSKEESDWELSEESMMWRYEETLKSSTSPLLYEASAPFSKELSWLRKGSEVFFSSEEIQNFEQTFIEGENLYIVPRNKKEPRISHFIELYYLEKKGWVFLIDSEIYNFYYRDETWAILIQFYIRICQNEKKFLNKLDKKIKRYFLTEKVLEDIKQEALSFESYQNFQKNKIKDYYAEVWWETISSYDIQMKEKVLLAIDSKLLSKKETYTNRVLLLGVSESLYHSTSEEAFESMISYKNYLYQSLFSLIDIGEIDLGSELKELTLDSFRSNMCALYS